MLLESREIELHGLRNNTDLADVQLDRDEFLLNSPGHEYHGVSRNFSYTLRRLKTCVCKILKPCRVCTSICANFLHSSAQLYENANAGANPEVERSLSIRRRRCCYDVVMLSFVVMVLGWMIFQSNCWSDDDEFKLLTSILESKNSFVVPLARAHSHNDYQQERPLEMALEAGFCSMEADIYLIKQELVLGHVKPTERLLETHYLNPLMKRTLQYEEKENGEEDTKNPIVKPVYSQSLPLSIPCEQITLLVDMKHEKLVYGYSVADIWTVLDDTLDRLNREANATVFECYSNDNGSPIIESKSTLTGQLSPVRVVVSGVDRDDIKQLAKDMVNKKTRCSTLDGRDIDVVDSDRDIKMVQTMVSAKFEENFQKMSLLELSQYVAKAHHRNMRVRFWDTENALELWDKLIAAGVDLIGTDSLSVLRVYLVGE